MIEKANGRSDDEYEEFHYTLNVISKILSLREDSYTKYHAIYMYNLHTCVRIIPNTYTYMDTYEWCS